MYGIANIWLHQTQLILNMQLGLKTTTLYFQ